MAVKRTIIAICENCHDGLYRHGDTLRHLNGNSNRCPGQGTDDTDDRAEPISFDRFRTQQDGPYAAKVLGAELLGDGKVRTDGIVAICNECVDYTIEGGALKRHGDSYRHLLTGKVRCPGQEDDDTDDRAEPITFARFAREYSTDFVAEVFAGILTHVAGDQAHREAPVTVR